MDNSITSFDFALKAYIRNCRTNLMSPGTVENYERVCSLFGRHMAANGFTEASISAVSSWKNSLSDKGIKITTLAGYMGMLDTFFSWAVEMEMLEKNPCVPAVMPSRKAVKKVQNQAYSSLLNESQFKAIITAERPKGVPGDKWARNKAIITILLSTAIRNSELRALTLNDLDFVNGNLIIEHGKGDKRRITAFPTIAQQAVKEYLASGYRPKNLPMSATLFGIGETASEWHEMNRIALSNLIKRNISLMIGGEGVRSHALRHACASILWDKGMSLEEISELLGHESVKTTEVYAERLRPALPSNHANNIFSEIA